MNVALRQTRHGCRVEDLSATRGGAAESGKGGPDITYYLASIPAGIGNVMKCRVPTRTGFDRRWQKGKDHADGGGIDPEWHDHHGNSENRTVRSDGLSLATLSIVLKFRSGTMLSYGVPGSGADRDRTGRHGLVQTAWATASLASSTAARSSISAMRASRRGSPLAPARSARRPEMA